MVDFRHLRYFVVLAEELHFARAAARLGIEQSPLSRQIQDLEADLRLRLFERSRRATSLTKAGERFLVDARRILNDIEGSVRSVRAFASGGQPLRLGLSEWVGGSMLSRLLQLCRDAEPRLELILTEGAHASLITSMLTGGLDAMLGPTPCFGSGLASTIAWVDGLVVLAPGDAMPRRKEPWQKTFSDRAWILPNAQALPGYARQTETLLADRGLTLRSDQTFICPKVLAGLVATGAGVALLPNSLVPDAGGTSAYPIEDPRSAMTIWMTVKRDASPPATKSFERLVAAAAAWPRHRDG